MTATRIISEPFPTTQEMLRDSVSEEFAPYVQAAMAINFSKIVSISPGRDQRKSTVTATPTARSVARAIEDLIVTDNAGRLRPPLSAGVRDNMQTVWNLMREPRLGTEVPVGDSLFENENRLEAGFLVVALAVQSAFHNMPEGAIK